MSVRRRSREIERLVSVDGECEEALTAILRGIHLNLQRPE
jgi:hypothetical protein